MLKLDKNSESTAQPKTLIITLLVSTILGIVFEWLFGERENGLSVPVFMLAAISALFLVLQVAGRKPKWTEYWLAAPLLFFAGMIAVRASPALKVLNTVAIFVLLIMLVYVAVGKKISTMKITEYLLAPLASVLFVQRFVAALNEAEALRRKRGPSTVAAQVVKGALLALPFLLIFILLFSSADSVFHKYVGDWAESLVKMDIWTRILPAVAVAAFFIGMLFLAQKSTAVSENAENDQTRTHAPTIAVTFLTLVNALFLGFILIQVKYLFGAEASLRALGLTYAEYARHGFFELLAVAGLSFMLLIIFEKHISKKDGRHAPSFKVLGAIHVLLVLGIVLSAHKRLVLYEDAYGFTLSRFFAHGLVFWLAAVFILLALNIMLEKLEKRFAFALFASVLVFLSAVNLANPDAFVAARNLERYQKTGKIDVTYLSQLSADAVPLIIPLFRDGKDAATNYLTASEYGFTSVSVGEILSSNQDWRSFNVATSKARTMMEARGFSPSNFPVIPYAKPSFSQP